MSADAAYEVSIIGGLFKKDHCFECLHGTPFGLCIDVHSQEKAFVDVTFNGILQGRYQLHLGRNILTYARVTNKPFMSSALTQHINLTLYKVLSNTALTFFGDVKLTLETPLSALPPHFQSPIQVLYTQALEMAMNQEVEKALHFLLKHCPRDMIIHRAAITQSLESYAASQRCAPESGHPE